MDSIVALENRSRQSLLRHLRGAFLDLVAELALTLATA